MISFVVTACNEYRKLLGITLQLIYLSKLKTSSDFIYLIDSSKYDPKINEAINYLKSVTDNVKVVFEDLDGDFAKFRNKAFKHCKNNIAAFFDADEVLSDEFVEEFYDMVGYIMRDYDIIALPRINLVSGIRPEHIEMYKWNINEKGWINYPDYQRRICRVSPNIKWYGKVHETLKGSDRLYVLPEEEKYSLIHIKDIEKQIEQNNFYNSLMYGS